MKKTPTANRMDKALYWASIVSTILGAIDATYLYIYKLTSNNAMCLGSGGCSTVNSSPYSELRGIPVSLLGLLAYLAILGLHILEGRSKFYKDNGPLLVFGMSLAGVAFSAYLTWIEFYVINATCPFCVASAVIITVIFVLAIIRMIRRLAL